MPRAYTPDRDDNARDDADELSDCARCADSILDTMRHRPGLLDCRLTDEELFNLEELLAKLSSEAGKAGREINDSLGASA